MIVRPGRCDEGFRAEVGGRAYTCAVFESMTWPTPLWWCYAEPTLRLLRAER